MNISFPTYFIILAILCAGCSRKGHFEYQGMYSIAVGVPNKDSEIESKDKIAFKPGQKYGYMITTVGFRGKHKFTEEFILPGPGVWSPEDTSETDTIKISTDKSKMTRTFNVDFDTSNVIGTIYGVADGDPKGKYIFRFSIDDEPFDQRSILIE